MESSPAAARTAKTPNPSTPTCTVPGLLVSLTKLFNLTKVCAAPTLETDNADDGDSSSPTTTKPIPNPTPDPGPDPRLVLLSLLHSVSSLKSGYVKLQRAHFPSYDAAGFAAADEAVASELDSVAALRCLCTASVGIAPLVDDRWALAQRLDAEARRRGARVDALAAELRRLRRHNARLSRQVKVAAVVSRSRKENEDRDRRGEKEKLLMSVPKELATTPAAVVGQFTGASRSVADFAELVLGGGGTCSLTTTTSRYSLEAHVWRAMLSLLVGGEECGSGGSFRRIMRFGDAVDALMQFPRSGFAAFCGAAYLAAVPAEAEAAACGGNSLADHRAFVSRGGHPRTMLYRAFADAARNVWAVRVLMAAAAARPCSEQGGGVRMFYAGRGSVYEPEFMESVVAARGEEEEARRRVEVEVEADVEADVEEKVSVAFTVTPGVKVGHTVVRCRVVLCRRRQGEGLVES